jgi:uncharacterized protein YggE
MTSHRVHAHASVHRTSTLCVSLIFVGLLLVATSLAAAQTPSVPPEPQVVTSGEGLVQAVPDRAWVTIGAESRAASPKDAQRRNTEAMTPVQQKLRAAGLAMDAIRTIGYDVQYEWEYINNKRVGKGYVARNTIEVRIDDVERVGEVLEIAAGSGATSLGGVRFDFKDRKKYERDALRLAVSDARAKADAAAAGAGRTIDRIVRIEESGAPPSIPRPMFREAVQSVAADAAPPIAIGQIEIRVNVTLTATLK